MNSGSTAPRRFSSSARIAGQRLARRHLLAFLHVDVAEVRIDGAVPALVRHDHEVAERRVTALEVVITVCLGDGAISKPIFSMAE